MAAANAVQIAAETRLVRACLVCEEGPDEGHHYLF